ncbi:glycosyltransferase [Candidatus Parcubacteria bacterium]|nr:glycosyltransferase [Patescibacteria group bacterium]MCG2693889.1 glycosyltransferase [Candidatus Parcubacteria bacterium]
MKKILYIITIPDWGGAQAHVYYSAGWPINTGDEISVLVGQSDNFKSKINLLDKLANLSDIKSRQLKNLVRPIHPLKDLLALIEIINYYNSEKPDIVHLNSSKAGILGSAAKLFSIHKPEIFYMVHGWVFLEPMNIIKKRFYIFLEKIASRWRDKILVLGEREKQIALDYKICPEKKLQIHHHPVLITQSFLNRDVARKELCLPEDKKIIGTIANFYPAKALHNLIEVASKINNPDIIFAVIGEGPLRDNYELLITNYELQDRVLLLGEKKDAAQYLKAFDIFVLPSIKEGMPYAILEAMHAKLPIVATEVGAVPEMLENYPNKTIVPPDDTEKLAEAIKKYL